jgi:TRAP-type C4-dicarboxylate transport system permease small subunit
METRPLPQVLARLLRIITWTENALLIAMLAAMVLLAAAQILLRNLLNMSIQDADQLLRLLVLWVAFLGAVATSREGKHIRVDAIARWLPARVNAGVAALTELFTVGVCLVLAWQSVRFVQSARESAELAFGALPVWVAATILPLAFALIALRYALRFVQHVQQACDRGDAE